MTDEKLQFLRSFVDDPEANGGLEWLQDCGIDAIKDLLGALTELQARYDAVQQGLARIRELGEELLKRVSL